MLMLVTLQAYAAHPRPVLDAIDRRQGLQSLLVMMSARDSLQQALALRRLRRLEQLLLFLRFLSQLLEPRFRDFLPFRVMRR